MDVHTPSQRTFNMSRIHAEGTKPELVVRKLLWANGYRYRLHRRDLPGTPDIVLPKYHAVIFVHGCFWHRHGCRATTIPATHRDFWSAKFKENVSRDKCVVEELQKDGWRVMIVWECCLMGKDADLTATGKQIRDWLESDMRYGVCERLGRQ